MAKIKVGWYCSFYVGSPKWQTLDDYESDECDTYFETIEDEDLWDEKGCRTECPKCHSKLWQGDEEPELIEVIDEAQDEEDRL